MARDSAEAQVATRLVQALVSGADIHVVSDAETALYGAHGGGPGVIVIAGTGSIALGRNAAGREARAGGWGWLVDDAGSAFAIGLRIRTGGQHFIAGADAVSVVVDLLYVTVARGERVDRG